MAVLIAQCALFGGSVRKAPFQNDFVRTQPARVSMRPFKHVRGRRILAQAFFNMEDDPILKEVMKEPIAFLGGVFAGLLRLNLDEEPLKDWIRRTSEEAGIAPDDVSKTSNGSITVEGPEEIQIQIE